MTYTINHTAKPDDLDADKIIAAYRNMSFTPEKRVVSHRNEYIDAVAGLARSLGEQVQSAQQETVATEQVEKYRLGYLKHINAILGARSRTASPMITGPAKFPTRQNEKRLETEHRRVDEYIAWQEKAWVAAHKAVAAARTPDQVLEDDWAALQEHLDRHSVKELLFGRIERLAKNGKVELVGRALAYISETRPGMFTAHHRIHGLIAVAEKSSEKLADLSDKEDRKTQLNGGVTMVESFADNRLRLIFPGKPDEETREKLRGSGWRWSPTNGAWQRQLTNAARWSAQVLTTPAHL